MCKEAESETNNHSTDLLILLQCVTDLCNDVDELIMLHNTYYRAAEDMLSKADSPQKPLSPFTRWLHERDLRVADDVNRFQHKLRELCHQHNDPDK